MFDLRSLEHSTIIYETQEEKPLLRIAWNKQDPNYLATFMLDSPKAIILDVRLPSLPAAELAGHQACMNSIAWAPHSSCRALVFFAPLRSFEDFHLPCISCRCLHGR